MERILGNFVNQPNRDFPLDCESFQYLQDNDAILALLGNIAGDKVVVHGCEINESKTERAPGYVFLRTKAFPTGELLPWEGGRIVSGMYVKEESISVTSKKKQYPQAYTKRSLAPGIGNENYAWDDFTDIKTIAGLAQECEELRSQIAGLKPVAVGTVEMWAGNASKDAIPENYALCDGAVLSAQAYPSLFAVIGRIHTPDNVPSGFFSLPDFRGRFIVGYDGDEEDYNVPGKTGGSATVILKEEEIPEHSHDFKNYYYVEKGRGGIDGCDTIDYNIAGSRATDYDNRNLWYRNSQTAAAGLNKAHENRPPYYTMVYIIKVK